MCDLEWAGVVWDKGAQCSVTLHRVIENQNSKVVHWTLFQEIRKIWRQSFEIWDLYMQQPTGPSKQPIITRYLDHVTGNQPTRTSISWFGWFLVFSCKTVLSVRLSLQEVVPVIRRVRNLADSALSSGIYICERHNEFTSGISVLTTSKPTTRYDHTFL